MGENALVPDEGELEYGGSSGDIANDRMAWAHAEIDSFKDNLLKESSKPRE